MRRLTILSICFCSFFCETYAQRVNEIPHYSGPALKVGDTVPDMVMGTFMNNPSRKTRFSDYRGKMLILVSWSTFCSSCLKIMPQEEALQKELNDSIQIVLISPDTIETEALVRQRLKKMNIPISLPVILADSVLLNRKNGLFPTGVYGSTVWIDKAGVVRVVHALSASINTARKVRAALSEKNFSYLISDHLHLYKKEKSLRKMETDDSVFAPLLSGTIYPFKDEYGVGGIGGELYVDTVHKSNRYSFINAEILELYAIALRPVFINNYLKERIYGPRDYIFEYESFQLLVKDTSRYTSILMPDHGYRDNSNYVRPRYCYELIVPPDMNEKDRGYYMFNSLNGYMHNRYGTILSIKKIKVPCYLLRQTATLDKFKSDRKGLPVKKVIRNGQKIIEFNGLTVRDILEGIVAEANIKGSSSAPPYMFDDVDYKGPVKMEFPDHTGEKRTIEDIRQDIRPYGLDIVLGEKEIEVAVISDK